MNRKKMQQQMFDLFDDHGILITFLSYQEHGEKKYDFYFKDTSNGALYNPLSTNDKGKRCHIPYGQPPTTEVMGLQDS